MLSGVQLVVLACGCFLRAPVRGRGKEAVAAGLWTSRALCSLAVLGCAEPAVFSTASASVLTLGFRARLALVVLREASSHVCGRLEPVLDGSEEEVADADACRDLALLFTYS